MSFQSTRFDMSGVMNRLRAIAEAKPNEPGDDLSHMDKPDPGMGAASKDIDTAGFTRAMQRLAAIKDAVGEDQYNALRAGVRSLYMNRRPNLQQMTALMGLLETVLAYVAEDNSLFQRLKADLAQDGGATPEVEDEPQQDDEPAMAGAPHTQTNPPEQPAPRPASMRELK